MIPYILISCYDKDKSMRQAALELIKHLDSRCEAADVKGAYYPIQGLDSSRIKNLKAKKVKYLCASLLSKKIEITADQSEILSSIGILSNERYYFTSKM